MGGFGFVGFEEFATGRDGIEKVGDLDAGADGAAGGALVEELAAVDQDFGALGGAGGAGDELEAGDAGDAGEGFAAEAEGADAEEVGGFADFGSGMALEGEEGVVRGEAVAVVLDTEVGFAAVAEFDFDAGGAGVEAVFDKFLDDGGGALDDLASGDLIGDAVGQDVDPGHELCQREGGGRGEVEMRPRKVSGLPRAGRFG